MQLLATSVDRARLPDDVEVLKDMLAEAAQAFQALRSQANQQMSALAAQLAEFKRRVFGGRSEGLAVLQPELWQDVVALPVPLNNSMRSRATGGAARVARPSMRACRVDASSTTSAKKTRPPSHAWCASARKCPRYWSTRRPGSRCCSTRG